MLPMFDLRKYVGRSAFKAVVLGAITFCVIGVVIVTVGVVAIQEETGAWPPVQPLDIVISVGVVLAAAASFGAVAWSLHRSVKELPYAMLTAAWKLAKEIATAVDPIERLRVLLRGWLDERPGKTRQPQT